MSVEIVVCTQAYFYTRFYGWLQRTKPHAHTYGQVNVHNSKCACRIASVLALFYFFIEEVKIANLFQV